MRLLLDSNALLWWLTDDGRLGQQARSAIADPNGIAHFSAASIWEIGIKSSLGRLKLGGIDLIAESVHAGFIELPVTSRHAWRSAWLTRYHQDPFDRLLVAQSEIEQLTLVTSDQTLGRYGVPILSC